MTLKYNRALVWLRRDLRLEDHAALAHASLIAKEVALVFVFDPLILKNIAKDDRRLNFIHQSLLEINRDLRKRGSLLLVRYGNPRQEIPRLASKIGAGIVIAHKDYEPTTKARDAETHKNLEEMGIPFLLLKDQVIFEGKEILNQSKHSFRVFTPYKNAWIKALQQNHYDERKIFRLNYCKNLEKYEQNWSLEKIGFKKNITWLETGPSAAKKLLENFNKKISNYERDRDFPSISGTSYLSTHLRFGTISIRTCVRAALSHKSKGASAWLNELIWRDFYQMILDQNPHVINGAFKKQYSGIKWPGKAQYFDSWCNGETGYPIVDAAMRHFNKTGWMHNRLRMVVASFLTKDLLIDWREGEKYFAKNLLDFDLASNNGGWQWSASTGCDAQPYFRVFNPYSQSEKFDPHGAFILKEIPELKNSKNIHKPEINKSSLSSIYPKPIVDHDVQRKKAIQLFTKFNTKTPSHKK